MNGLVILSIGLLLFTYLDWASLHDISVDYVSLEILKYLGITLSEPPPDWVNTRGEWTIVRIALIARIIFFILTAATAGYLIKKWPVTAD
jgi:hypothetical protein